MQKNGTTSQLESRIDGLKESVRNLVDAGGEKAGQLKERAIGVKDSVVENSEVAINRVSALIKEHPIAALGVAFAVGYVAIRMLRK
jgi:ElaB/YqjD/DUF883 family membrane-anchored ribosome-binding protein